eukprot:757110-Hanusia_phi.AAC.2
MRHGESTEEEQEGVVRGEGKDFRAEQSITEGSGEEDREGRSRGQEQRAGAGGEITFCVARALRRL